MDSEGQEYDFESQYEIFQNRYQQYHEDQCYIDYDLSSHIYAQQSIDILTQKLELQEVISEQQSCYIEEEKEIPLPPLRTENDIQLEQQELWLFVQESLQQSIPQQVQTNVLSYKINKIKTNKKKNKSQIIKYKGNCFFKHCQMPITNCDLVLCNGNRVKIINVRKPDVHVAHLSCYKSAAMLHYQEYRKKKVNLKQTIDIDDTDFAILWRRSYNLCPFCNLDQFYSYIPYINVIV